MCGQEVQHWLLREDYLRVDTEKWITIEHGNGETMEVP